jgi:hypothetical protein
MCQGSSTITNGMTSFNGPIVATSLTLRIRSCGVVDRCTRDFRRGSTGTNSNRRAARSGFAGHLASSLTQPSAQSLKIVALTLHAHHVDWLNPCWTRKNPPTVRRRHELDRLQLARNSVVLNADLAATATKVILYVSDGKKW